MEFKTVSELEKYLLKQISQSLEKDVAFEGRDLMREHIQKDVYEQYTPTHYDRTWELINSCDSSMETNDALELTNTRQGKNGNDVPYVIEYGKGYTYSHLDEVIGARPFMKKTYEDLAKGRAKLFLRNAFIKRGFKIEG